MRHLLFALALLVSGVTSATATPLDIGSYSGSGCCGGLTRGYWFTAPTDFTIDRLSMPTATNGAGDTLQVILLNNVPPVYGNTTNSFTSLGYWTGVSSVDTNIAVHTGDLIGVLGYAGFTPYGPSTDYATSIDGHSIVLERLGFQSTGMAANVFTEHGSIGYIALDYSVSHVPEPASMSLIGLGLLAFAARRKAARN